MGGALKIVVDPGSDILIRNLRFGPFGPVLDSIPMQVARRGFWLSPAACDAVAGAPACDSAGECYSCGSRIAWLTSPAGGSLPAEVAKQAVAQDFPAECGACDTSVIHTLDIHGAPTTTTTTAMTETSAAIMGKIVTAACITYLQIMIAAQCQT